MSFGFWDFLPAAWGTDIQIQMLYSVLVIILLLGAGVKVIITVAFVRVWENTDVKKWRQKGCN